MNDSTGGRVDKAKDVYIVGLRNQHAVEQQALELLQRQIGRLENYPELAARMREHIDETRAQWQRIEELLAAFDTSHSTAKDLAMSALGNMMALGHAPASDEVIRNTLANYAFEHYEIASYRALLVLAESCGQTAAASPLRQSLQEEERMAQWIADHIAPTTQHFVERLAAGQTAGV